MAIRQTAYLERVTRSTPPRKVVVLDQGDDILPFERIECPDMRAIGEAWQAMPRSEGQILPCWQAFDPLDFKPCLNKLCVLKAHDWRADEIEFSLYGGHPTEFLGNGKPLVMQAMRHDALRSGNYIDIRDRAGRAIDNQAPQYVRKTLSWNDRTYIEYEALMLPFAADNGVQRLLQPISARARLSVVETEGKPARK